MVKKVYKEFYSSVHAALGDHFEGPPPSEDEQVAYTLMALTDLLNWVKALLNHTKLNPSGRWPCPYCGRKEGEGLTSVEIKLREGKGLLTYQGCWYCNLEPYLKRLDWIIR